MLRGVGIDETEELVYTCVLRLSPALLRDIVEDTGLGVTRVRRLLASLEQRGLVSRAAARGSRVIATRPDLGIEALILEREEGLRSARQSAQTLLQELWHHPNDASPVDLVEVVVGRDAVADRAAQILRTTREEVLAFVKPPYGSGPSDETVETQSLGRGATWRGIYDQGTLALPGEAEALRRLVSSGEQARVLPDLPMKLLIVDRQSALLPLTMGEETALESAVVVHTSALLEALVELFESLWQRATPVRAFRPGQQEGAGADQVSEQDALLLTLLGAGMKDEAIARRMGLSVRTVRRRIQLLLSSLGASTRFQAGLQVADRRWLAADPRPPGD